MSDVFVVFGSASDKKVYEPLLKKFDYQKISYEFKILSAHKTAKELDKALAKTKAKIFVCGAGLSAALPGVVAANQTKPVIGIPCKGAYNGLDAFLSVAQMPPDIPVICVGVENVKSAAKSCEFYLSNLKEIVLIEKKKGEEKKQFEKCKEFMESNRIPFKVGLRSEFDSSNIFIEFVEIGKKIDEVDCTVITVPVKSNSTEKDALKSFSQLQNAYSVGLGNYKNAAISALELINLQGNFDSLLKQLRKKAAKKVLDAKR